MPLLLGIVIRSPLLAGLRREFALAVGGCAMVESFELDTGIFGYQVHYEDKLLF